MINAYIIVREQKNIDNKYIVCLEKDDALKIANEMTDYWLAYYFKNIELDDVDFELYGDSIYSVSYEELFSVDVMPQEIKEAGEK